MNTTENNKLIAEFMGWRIQKDPTERFFGRYKSPIGTWYKEIDLAFHQDWNWLMEVVEKMKNIILLKGITFTNELIAGLITVNKEATYNACVEFIKWHNEQNNNRAE